VFKTFKFISNSKSQDDNAEQNSELNPGLQITIGFWIDIFSEYFIFLPSIRGLFGIG
jgi:heme/copper-type cytochrome/quinol oxidase subunit 3